LLVYISYETHCCCCCSWTFAEQELRALVRGLCAFSGKQLQAVSHLLSSDHIKQIKIAMDIPPINQASSH
jgi:hypothetical protein